jgi:hypothetical protein
MCIFGKLVNDHHDAVRIARWGNPSTKYSEMIYRAP